MHSRISVVAGIVFVTLLPTPVLADKVVRRDAVAVSYQGVGEAQATAVANTVQAARTAAAKLGFDMPATINVNVSARLVGGAGLFNDGDRGIFLTVRSEKDFRKPSESGVFVIYGLCHEVGHLAMYRVVREHRWMTTAAAEGWAHYLGSRLVDAVYETEGKDLWPDRYDFREDGMRRLKRQREEARPSPTVRGAGLWADFAETVGDGAIVETFAAWSKAKIDPADPGKALAAALPAGEAVRKWWSTAGPLFVARSAVSPFETKTAKAGDLTGKPRGLARDDGTSAGKRSIAGAGHAVTFDAPAEGWYLTAVRVFGARYGGAEAPEDKFTVFVLDDQYRRIAEFPLAYARFDRGDPQWVDLEVTPTLVPAKFVVGLDFQPTARKGVFVHHDADPGGHSATGIPGREFQKFATGDWMIRAVVDQLRDAK
jgi:RNA polymerase sigma-70 factor (ECF subfamily)